MVVLAPGGPPMSRRVYLSHPDMPKGDFRYWPRLCKNAKTLNRDRATARPQLVEADVRSPGGKSGFGPACVKTQKIKARQE